MASVVEKAVEAIRRLRGNEQIPPDWKKSVWSVWAEDLDIPVDLFWASLLPQPGVRLHELTYLQDDLSSQSVVWQSATSTEPAHDLDLNDQELDIGSVRGTPEKWECESTFDMDECSSPTPGETGICSFGEQSISATSASTDTRTSMKTLRVRATRFYRERLRLAKLRARRFLNDLQLERIDKWCNYKKRKIRRVWNAHMEESEGISGGGAGEVDGSNGQRRKSYKFKLDKVPGSEGVETRLRPRR
ncbi:hypothetical protein BJ508DRAFT_306413 [Ascobolus immersus RN42]|uniref:Uncharacterized protein n=1 Tax=Ascobolus immersus RN42 TaxID=1160509 RepID=A0A3N4IBK0_ASCIM|nr:hypothetical protein BJ508DRAFT_306413 [Ascobolus immersus RN42]